MDIYQQHTHNRSVGWSTWHLEWCTKYRYKIFYSEKLRNLCKIAIVETAKRHRIDILDYEVDIDHVHVVASLPLAMKPTKAMQLLKGCSARILFHEIPYLKGIYWKGHLWSPGKFMASIGHITVEKAKAYLGAHHAKDLLPHLGESHTFKYGRMSSLKLFPYHKIMKERNVRSFKRKLNLIYEKFDNGKIAYDRIYDFLEGWIAYAKNANSFKLRKKILKNFENKFSREISTKELNRYQKLVVFPKLVNKSTKNL